MTLPAQIQKQVDDAKAIIEQHYGENAGAADPVTPAVEEGSAPAQATQEPAAQAAQPQESVRTQEEPATSAEDENSPTYAQRWRSQQGIVNAVNRKLQEAEARTANLERLVATLQSAPAAPQAQHTQSRLVTDTDVTEYGSEMVDFARRVTREEMAPIAQALHDLNRRMEQLQGMAPTVQRVVANQQASAEQSFADKLTRAVPDWGRINDDPGFHEWLLTPDGMTGLQRQTYLADAEQSLDLQRVVSIFNAWKRESGAQTTSVTPVPTPTATSNASKLEKQVAPGRASASVAAPSQRAEKQYSPADIAAFYKDKLQGKFKGREAEAIAIERDIFKAQGEGRVVRHAA
jgi:hypothetical protein